MFISCSAHNEMPAISRVIGVVVQPTITNISMHRRILTGLLIDSVQKLDSVTYASRTWLHCSSFAAKTQISTCVSATARYSKTVRHNLVCHGRREDEGADCGREAYHRQSNPGQVEIRQCQTAVTRTEPWWAVNSGP